MDFAQGAVIARTVVLTFGYATADSHVYVVTILFVHRIKPPFGVKRVCANSQKNIDICKFFLYNIGVEKNSGR